MRSARFCRWSTFAIFAALFIALPIAAQEAPPGPKLEATTPEKAEPAKSLTDKELYKALLPSVAWIRTAPTNDPQACMGTGFVVDVDRRLVVTNEHVVK